MMYEAANQVDEEQAFRMDLTEGAFRTVLSRNMHPVDIYHFIKPHYAWSDPGMLNSV
jgi:hypothetical protein